MREYHYKCQRSSPLECHSVFQPFLYRSLPQGGHGGNARVARVDSNVPVCSIPCRNRSPFQCATSAPHQPASAIKPLMADAHSRRGNRGSDAERTHRRRETEGRLCDSDNIKFQSALDQLYLQLTAHRFIHKVIETPCGVIKAARRQAAYVSLIMLQNTTDSRFIALRCSMDHRKRKQSLISVTLRMQEVIFISSAAGAQMSIDSIQSRQGYPHREKNKPYNWEVLTPSLNMLAEFQIAENFQVLIYYLTSMGALLCGWLLNLYPSSAP